MNCFRFFRQFFIALFFLCPLNNEVNIFLFGKKYSVSPRTNISLSSTQNIFSLHWKQWFFLSSVQTFFFLSLKQTFFFRSPNLNIFFLSTKQPFCFTSRNTKFLLFSKQIFSSVHFHKTKCFLSSLPKQHFSSCLWKAFFFQFL